MKSRARIQSHPLHAIMVSFPIGLWTTSLVFDAIGWYRQITELSSTGWYCMLAGCIGAVFAAIPGVIDLFSVVPKNSSARGRGYRHGLLNTAILLIFVANLAYRGYPSFSADKTSLTLSILGVVLLGISGWMGGTLVYRNQIGIDHLHANAAPRLEFEVGSWTEPLCKETDLKEGQMAFAQIQGARVAIARCEGNVVAFTDQCTHKGGPLSDGALLGCAVQCPWHGSQFDVVTGKVLAGPTGTAIETYDVDIRAGQIFVSPKRSRFREGEKAA